MPIDLKKDDDLDTPALGAPTQLLPEDRISDRSSQAASSPRLERGLVINERYEILRLIGRGGMGEVYLALDRRINRNVALKVLHSDLVSSEEGVQRFSREAQAVSALNHPHIMTIYEIDRSADGGLFFVAEYIEGTTLNRLIAAGISMDTALDISIQVASALDAAHEAGITHRDIKPENIMVRSDGYVKILDFGLAKLTEKRPAHLSDSELTTDGALRTNPGVVMGTAAYMSPEQARGKTVDSRTDIWSLGVVIYEMLAGQRPFPGETTADVIVSVLLNDPLPIDPETTRVTPELASIIDRSLAKNADERYSSIKQLRSDLQQARKQIEIDDSLRTFIARGDAFAGEHTGPKKAGTTQDLSVQSTEPPTSTKVSRLAIPIVVFIVAAALIGSYFYVTSARSTEIDSIAVLPFDNSTGNPELNYLSDGLSENLLDKLSQLPQIKVISRSSSFKFRGADLDLRDVAEKLGVKAIVTGSVSQVGDEYLVRVDIVDPVDNRHIAGGQYRSKTGDIVKLQNDIARAATEQFQLKLSATQAKRITNSDTENSEAFQYYLSGLVELNGPQDVRGKALEYFEQATKLDPDFAAAYAEIAFIYWSRSNGSDDPGEIMPKAKLAAEKALSLNPDLAKAHAVMAMVREYELKWDEAELEYKRALELSPNLGFTLDNYAFFLAVVGRPDEALATLEQQHLRDPINRRMALLQKAIILSQARKFDEAINANREAQAEDPTKEVSNFSLGYAFAGKGQYDDAAKYYQRSVELLGGDGKYSQPLVYQAATLAHIPGKRPEAVALIEKIENMSGYHSPALMAIPYAALENRDKAFENLEQALIKRDPLIRFIGTGYEYDPLRSDPRFADILKRTGLSK